MNFWETIQETLFLSARPAVLGLIGLVALMMTITFIIIRSVTSEDRKAAKIAKQEAEERQAQQEAEESALLAETQRGTGFFNEESDGVDSLKLNIKPGSRIVENTSTGFESLEDDFNPNRDNTTNLHEDDFKLPDLF